MMLSFEESYKIVNKHIEQLKFDRDPKSLYAPIKYILSLGGKRIRPVLILLANDLYSGRVEDALWPATAIEVFHNFTLLHDDLMDRSDQRRGKQTVHKVWNDNVAILSGDAMLIEAYRIFEQINPSLQIKLLPLFSETALQVCEGQQYDMEFEEREDVTLDEYFEMITLKTSVLLACALKMGAIIGNAPGEEADLLYDFGIQIGLAFQLQDDLLDCYADQKVFGKSIGDDILEKKKTFLSIRLREEMGTKEYSAFCAELDDVDLSPQSKIDKTLRLYGKYSIKEQIEEVISSYFQRGMEILDQLERKGREVSVLRKLTEQLLHRDR